MNAVLQGSLLDLCGEAGPGPLGSSVRRTALARGAWVDLRPGWIAGADALFERLAAAVPWRAEKRYMYDRVVEVPRLLCFYPETEPLPDPVLEDARQRLSEHYAEELGEPFRTAGLCLYRDGRDSVAWHGDTIGRGSTEDTMVAILSLGTARPLLLRPRAGNGADSVSAGGARASGTGAGAIGAVGDSASDAASSGTLRYHLGHGDLLVMGGSCQRTWEHAVPKSARSTGPRISVQFSPRGVR